MRCYNVVYGPPGSTCGQCTHPIEHHLRSPNRNDAICVECLEQRIEHTGFVLMNVQTKLDEIAAKQEHIDGVEACYECGRTFKDPDVRELHEMVMH